jgi:regulator of nucleoside diphosphate kinase
MDTSPVYITESDSQRLSGLLQSLESRNPSARTLRRKLDDAVIVADEAVPSGVITLESRFEVRDLDADNAGEYTLVFPRKADFTRGRLNVLAPVGMALLGRHELDVIEWSAPAGLKRFQVLRVTHQPEAVAISQ